MLQDIIYIISSYYQTHNVLSNSSSSGERDILSLQKLKPPVPPEPGCLKKVLVTYQTSSPE